jgi:hypothetical protein
MSLSESELHKDVGIAGVRAFCIGNDDNWSERMVQGI